MAADATAIAMLRTLPPPVAAAATLMIRVTALMISENVQPCPEDRASCSSADVSFTTAMAGRGTRVAFAGALDLKPGLLGSLGSIEPLVSGFLEAIVTTIIPRNLRAVVEAAAAFELPQDTS